MEEKKSQVEGVESKSEQVDDSKRNIVAALLGGLGVAALSGCTNQVSADAPEEPIGRASTALTGTQTMRWVTFIGTDPTGSSDDGVKNLRDLDGTNHGEIVVAEGFWEPGDGGGGVFYWDESTSCVDDGGTVIVPHQDWSPTHARMEAAWKRIYSGAVSVKWFGAKGDGGTNDLYAIQRAVNCKSGEVYVPPGNYMVAGTIYVNRATLISGAATPSSVYLAASTTTLSAICQTTSNATLFEFTGTETQSGNGGGLSKLGLFYVPEQSGGTAVRITGTTDNARANWVRINDLNIESAGGTSAFWQKGIVIDGSGLPGKDSGIRDCTVSRCRIVVEPTSGNAVEINHGFNVHLTDIQFDKIGAGGEGEFPRILIGSDALDPSSNILLSNVTGYKLKLGNAQCVVVSGGAFSFLDDAASTTGLIVSGTRLNAGWAPSGSGCAGIFLDQSQGEASSRLVVRTGPQADALLDRASQVNLGDNGGIVALRSSSTQPTDAPPVGTIVFNRSPTPGGSIGWVYTSSGWKTWGSISA